MVATTPAGLAMDDTVQLQREEDLLEKLLGDAFMFGQRGSERRAVSVIAAKMIERPQTILGLLRDDSHFNAFTKTV